MSGLYAVFARCGEEMFLYAAFLLCGSTTVAVANILKEYLLVHSLFSTEFLWNL